MLPKRTIILFCLKRSGTTAIYRAFRDHQAVGIPHVDQTLQNWEPNFWNYAQDALQGEPGRFQERLARACPFLGPCEPRSADEVFELWDRIADHLGPILFDKTPSLILPGRGLDLLRQYRATGRDVRFLAVVRDPRDVIASQFELWSHLVEDDSPEQREATWVEGYEHLERLKDELNILTVRYEDLAANPAALMPQIYQHCGLEDTPDAYQHIHPVNIGRHRQTNSPAIARWTPGPAMCHLMARYGYQEHPRKASEALAPQSE